MKTNIKKERGITLVEISFYFVIVACILLTAMTFAIQISTLTMQSQNLHELQANIDVISQKLTYSIQTAESINAGESVFDNDNGKLSLIVNAAEKSPTSYYLQDGAIYMKEGSSTAIKLSTDLVTCTLLKFQKISYYKSPDQVIIDAEFKPKNTDVKNLEQTLPIHTSVTLRKL